MPISHASCATREAGGEPEGLRYGVERREHCGAESDSS